MWANYHTHSTWCDGKKPIADVVDTANNQGLLAIGLSSHAPLPFPRSWCMKPDTLDDYLAEIDLHKKKSPFTQVYSGVEADYIPGVISPAAFSSRVDFTIGSIHFVDSFPDGDRWEIDGTYQLFRDGLKAIFGDDIQAAISRYFELTREMVITAHPDIVGHLDKIKIQNREGLFSEAEHWYRDAVWKTLDTIAAAGSIVEVNTRGLYQKKCDSTYPGSWILEEMCRRAIPVTLSSDAHHPDDLVNRFPDAAEELLKAGFKKIRILLDGRWQDVAFDNRGIRQTNTHHPMA